MSAMTPYERLLLPENMVYAWRKARRMYSSADGYVDYGEVSEFELDLEFRLNRIRERFRKGHYRLKRVRPLSIPKKILDEVPVDRQYYHVAVDGQVAWIAIANVLGPEIDQLMPSWSYGNRLYRPAWYDRDHDEYSRPSKLEIGPYRHQGGHLYRKFQHSWPLFRRHIDLTAQTMIRESDVNIDDLEPSDQLAVISARKDRLPYLMDGFWRRGNDTVSRSDLHYAAFDLKHFYPSIVPDAI